MLEMVLNHSSSQFLNGNQSDFIPCVGDIEEEGLIRNEEIKSATNIAHRFTAQQIKTATNDYAEVLGEGGFGPVYKGNLPTGEDVAIKILSNASQQGAQEFLNEVCVYLVYLG